MYTGQSCGDFGRVVILEAFVERILVNTTRTISTSMHPVYVGNPFYCSLFLFGGGRGGGMKMGF